MKTLLLAFGVATALAMASTAPANAHHAFSAEFDSNRPVTLEGSITRIEWINPHAWLHVAVTDEDGNVTDWMVETGSPNTLVRRGLSRDTIPPGTAVVIEGFQARNGTNRASGQTVATPDGERLLIGSEGRGAAPVD